MVIPSPFVGIVRSILEYVELAARRTIRRAPCYLREKPLGCPGSRCNEATVLKMANSYSQRGANSEPAQAPREGPEKTAIGYATELSETSLDSGRRQRATRIGDWNTLMQEQSPELELRRT